ncbi:MAG: PQQ-binding-like beta-propeller repeat protein [Candidatus Sumerlaeota bacterium]|nr:PQQ-binding-like beta-propeller repeat protein [Candidatus Sumerlaeota bacterium]
MAATKKRVFVALGVILALAVCAATGLAVLSSRARPNMTVTGVVRDKATGQPISGASVSDDGYGPPPYRSAVADSAGVYRYATWPEEHTIVAQALGYKPQRQALITRNMVSSETGLPVSFVPLDKHGNVVDAPTTGTRNVKWVAKLGSQTYGTPTVAGGKVFIGTNNGARRDPRLQGDRGVLMCFDEATGKFLWQLAVSKLKNTSNFNGDDAGLGICSTPTVQGDRLYMTTTRCEAVCLDVNGLANGNDGPFRDEGEYIAAPFLRKPGKPPDVPYSDKTPPGEFPPLPLTPIDGDIVWRYDFIAELDVWPQDATDCSPLVYGGLVYVGTSNGVDKSHKRIPSPEAPSLIALDKDTGTLVAVDDAKIGPRIFHGTWSSPSLAQVNGKTLILFGGADGFCYAFDPTPVASPDGKGKVLRKVWRCDCNPPEYRMRNGKPLPYDKNSEGPSEANATPVFYNNRVYTTIGQDTRHGPGPGALTCIDPTGTGDISAAGVVWRYTGLNRSFSTPSIVDGLVFVGDVRGVIHCLDAETGRLYWTHDTKGQMIGSTLVADGKVYAGNEDGDLTVLAASKQKKLLNKMHVGTAIHATPVAANGALYVATQSYLYAVWNPAQ